jgi:hypothetical protein
VSRPKEQATRPRVLLWVKNGSATFEIRLPLYPHERTSRDRRGRSVSCQKRNSALPVITRAEIASGGERQPQLRRLVCKRNLATRLRQNNTTGKSPKTCPAPIEKIFRLPRRGKSVAYLRPSHPTRGAARDRHETRGGMRWTWLCRQTNGAGCVRQKRVVLTPRCRRQVARSNSRGDGGKQAGHRGELAISRKAIAQGMPDSSASPVCSCAHLFVHIARETAGAACTRHSLLPLPSRETILCKPRANPAARRRTHVWHRHCEHSEAIHVAAQRTNGLLRCARNDVDKAVSSLSSCPI